MCYSIFCEYFVSSILIMFHLMVILDSIFLHEHWILQDGKFEKRKCFFPELIWEKQLIDFVKENLITTHFPCVYEPYDSGQHFDHKSLLVDNWNR